MTRLLWTAAWDPKTEGPSHGAFGVVDPASATHHTLCVWNHPASPRHGWGLRSATWHQGRLWVLLADVLVQLDEGLNLVATHSHPLLGRALRVRGRGDLILVAVGGWDGLLGLDPAADRWIWGLRVERDEGQGRLRPLDPSTERPRHRGLSGLNQLLVVPDGLWVGGAGLKALLRIQGEQVVERRALPEGCTGATPLPGVGLVAARPREGRLLWRGMSQTSLPFPDAGDRALDRPRVPSRPWPQGMFAQGPTEVVCGAPGGLVLTAWGDEPAWSEGIQVCAQGWITDLTPWPDGVPLQPTFGAAERYLAG